VEIERGVVRGRGEEKGKGGCWAEREGGAYRPVTEIEGKKRERKGPSEPVGRLLVAAKRKS